MTRSLFKVLAVVFVLFVCSAIALVGICALWLATTKKLPVADPDKAMIVRSVDLVPYFDGYSLAEKWESFEKVRYLDQSDELTYEYDSPEEDEPYISSSVTYERNRSDANSTYLIEWTAESIGLNIADGDIDLEENNVFYSCGDRSRFGNILHQGHLTGHVLVAQKGNAIYAILQLQVSQYQIPISGMSCLMIEYRN